MSITAMKQALDALEECRRDPRLKYEHSVYDKTITALRSAITEAEKQEPVALETVYETIIHWDEGGGKRSRRELARRIVAIYTTPPAAQRKEAVNAQLLKALEALVDNEDARSWGVFGVDNRSAFTKARAAIKAAKGEKHD